MKISHWLSWPLSHSFHHQQLQTKARMCLFLHKQQSLAVVIIPCNRMLSMPYAISSSSVHVLNHGHHWCQSPPSCFGKSATRTASKIPWWARFRLAWWRDRRPSSSLHWALVAGIIVSKVNCNAWWSRMFEENWRASAEEVTETCLVVQVQ